MNGGWILGHSSYMFVDTPNVQIRKYFLHINPWNMENNFSWVIPEPQRLKEKER